MKRQTVRLRMPMVRAKSEHLFGRRNLLLGGGAAVLSTACGAGDEPEPEPIGTLGEAVTATPKPDAPDFSAVPSWTWAQISAGFNMLRDSRYLTWSDFPAFKRRITWLYPEEGCEARAELIGHWISTIYGVARPYKISVVGMVTLATENHPKGSVDRGFHVVPVIKSSGSGCEYVLDPAVAPQGPQRWSAYVDALTFKGGSQISVKDGDFYSPVSFNGTGGLDKATTTIKGLLTAEWARQVNLDNNPFETLGDFPPWS